MGFQRGSLGKTTEERLISNQNLVGYWPLDGSSLDFSEKSLNEGLVAYFKLDESSGNAVDSVNGYVGTNTSTTYTTGKINNCAVFNGSSSKLVSNNSIISGSGDATFSAWVKVAAAAAICPIIAKRDSNASGLFVWRMEDSGVMNFFDYNGSAFLFNTSTQSNTAANDGNWHHVAFVISGNTGTFYLDGLADGTKTCSSRLSWNTQLPKIGNDSVDNLWYNGSLDEFCIWNRALTATEVSTLYSSGNGKQYPLPTVRNSNNGTVTGALPVPSQNPAIPASLAYKFNGSSDYITVPNISGIKSVGFWAYPTATSNSYFQVAAGIYISDTSGTLSATGFTSPSIYVDGVLSTTIRPNRWQFVVVTSGTAVNGSTMYIGRQNAGYLAGNQQEVSLWTKALSGQEIQAIYNQSKRRYRTLSASIMAILGTTYTLALAQGTFALTGIATTFNKTLNILMGAGSFTLTGIDALFQRARGILASSGSFVFTGVSVGITSSRSLALAVGSFTLTGFDVILEKLRGLMAEVGSFILTGYNVTKPFFWSNPNKNTSSWTDTTKNTSSWTDKNKS